MKPVMRRLPRLVIGAYPPNFRERYGDELSTLVDDLGPCGVAVTVDLVRGAALAWLRPAFTGDAAQQRRHRLQATVTTVFVVWAAAFMAAAAFGRAVDDPPLFGAGDVAQRAFSVGQFAAATMAIAVGISGLGYWLLLVVPAVRARRRDIWLPAAAPGVIVAGWLAITAMAAEFVGLALGAGGPFLGSAQPLANPGLDRVIPILVVLATYVVITLACAGGCVLAASMALRRAALSARRLQPAVLAAVAGTAGISVQAVSAVVCVAGVHRGVWPTTARDVAQAMVPASILVIAAVVGVVSSWRGARAI